jgi:hypothetical protein
VIGENNNDPVMGQDSLFMQYQFTRQQPNSATSKLTRRVTSGKLLRTRS